MKAFLKRNVKSQFIKNILQYIYHEARWLIEKGILAIIHSDVSVVRLKKNKLDEIRKLGYRSQAGQDFFISNIINHKVKHGSFVDIGANDPEFNNNTYYFETKCNWNGIAIEPQEKYLEAWKGKRKAKFISCCIGNGNGTVEFLQYESPNEWEDQLSCISDRSRKEDNYIKAKTIKVEMHSFGEIASENALSDITLMSIDVEGYEEEVLKGIDFRMVRPKVILIENCRKLAGDESIRKILFNAGYVFSMRIWTFDDLFLEQEFADSLS